MSYLRPAPIIAPIFLSLFAMTLTGCGEDDNIFGIKNNELEINHFERSNNDIARIETDFEDGERDIDIENIKGSFNASNINTLPVSTVLADDFEGTLEDRYIEVDNRTVTRPIFAKNSNERFDYTVTYRTLNLESVDALDYVKGNRSVEDRGIFTDLNNFTDIPNNISFPSGSVCYIPVVTSDRDFFAFNDKTRTRFDTLDDWVDNAEERFGNNQSSRTTTVKVGIDNEHRAAQVRFFATNDRAEYNYYGVQFAQDIFDANFVREGQARPNEDSTRGVIDCTLVNDVAADFLEAQIRRYY